MISIFGKLYNSIFLFACNLSLQFGQFHKLSLSNFSSLENSLKHFSKDIFSFELFSYNLSHISFKFISFFLVKFLIYLLFHIINILSTFSSFSVSFRIFSSIICLLLLLFEQEFELEFIFWVELFSFSISSSEFSLL